MPSLRHAVSALVVENDRALLRALVEFLEREGFRVTTEVDGRWALRTFEVRPIDLVVLDVNLPGLDGFQLSEKIQRYPKARPAKVVVLSDRRHAHPEREAARHGASALLRKPISMDELREVLRGALGDRYPMPAAAPAQAGSETRESQIEPRLDPPRALKDAERLADGASRFERDEVEQEHTRRRPARTARWGRLHGARFPQLLHEMNKRDASGALYVRWEEAKKIVYLREGAPVMVKSNLLDECLGRVMVRERMISEEECEQSLRLMRSSRRQQGTVLIEMGCISPHNLVYALDRQLRLKLYDILAWRGGEFTFAAGVEAPPSHTGLEGSPGQLIKEGIRETYNHARIVEVLAAQRAERLWASDDPAYRFQELGLSRAERQLVDEIIAAEGRWTVAQVLRGEMGRESRFGDLDVLSRAQLVLALLCTEVLLLGDGPEETGSWLRPRDVTTQRNLAEVGELHDDAEDTTTQTPTDEDDDLAAALEAMASASDPLDEDVEPILAETAQDIDPDLDGETLETKRSGRLTGSRELPDVTREDEDEDTDIGSELAAAPTGAEDESTQRGSYDGSLRLPALGAGAITPDDVRRELATRHGARPGEGDAQPFGSTDTSQTDIGSHTALATIRRTELVRRLGLMQGRAGHHILGLEEEASESEIQQSYNALASELRPDRFRSAPTEIRDAAQEAMEILHDAYQEMLRGPQIQPRRTTAELSIDVDRLLQAEREYRRGLAHLDQDRPAAAREAFRRANQRSPNEAEFLAALAWATHLSAPQEPSARREALEGLEQAQKLNPRHDRVYVYRGSIYRATGNDESADAEFERALQCNPDCEEALRELGLLNEG